MTNHIAKINPFIRHERIRVVERAPATRNCQKLRKLIVDKRRGNRIKAGGNEGTPSQMSGHELPTGEMKFSRSASRLAAPAGCGQVVDRARPTAWRRHRRRGGR